jgi:hypothetical protein
MFFLSSHPPHPPPIHLPHPAHPYSHADLNFLYLAARLLEVLSPDLSRASLSAVAADIRASMLEEVDFRKEAGNIASFASYLDNMGLRGLATCPDVSATHCLALSFFPSTSCPFILSPSICTFFLSISFMILMKIGRKGIEQGVEEEEEEEEAHAFLCSR